MFRASQFIDEIFEPGPVDPRRDLPGPVVIWNLIRRCNLLCKHCYTISADKVFKGELSTGEVMAVMADLKDAHVPALILSGGEPLLRPDIFEISKHAVDLGFHTALSSNGTLMDEETADKIADVGYGYVGVSVDGIGETHNKFRRKENCFEEAMHGLRLCRDRNQKIGLRFTMTEDNAHELPDMLQLIEDEGIDRFYFSHLNYAGRGNHNRKDDAMFRTTRDAMEILLNKTLDWKKRGLRKEVVTGNNDADGIFMLMWVERNFPEAADHIAAKLKQWGGNASGVNVANIDNLGIVHPDTMWWHHNLGNVKERKFADIWSDTSDPLMAGLKQRPRTIGGRCGECKFFDICGGNTRVRAHRMSDDFWAEDPGCYLNDDEIGASGAQRLELKPFSAGRTVKAEA
jgi:heme d1 biosynthesis radical SAM protein NirJ